MAAALPAEDGRRARLRQACETWDRRDGTRKLFARDASLWTGGDEARWLDWLDPGSARVAVEAGRKLARGAEVDGLTHAVVVGMGGSSLAPEVLSLVLGRAGTGLEVSVLDTVDPARVQSALGRLDPARTLVVVASKSGSTLEPNLVKDVLWARWREALGEQAARARLVAITDPGSSLDREARAGAWRAVIPGVPGIGGRFSALSPFGLVPACLLGIDADTLLHGAVAERDACATRPAHANPGVALGIALGTLALEGRDKLTLVASPRLAPLGAWIEQLVAESTGKRGVGILPVDQDPAIDAVRLGEDRVIVAIRLGEEPGDGYDARVARLAEEGHPVLAFPVPRRIDLGAAFYRWEIATAVAGSILGIHPFDQPDVESSKVAARERLERLERSGDAPGVGRVVLARGGGVTLEVAAAAAGDWSGLPVERSIAHVLAAHLGALAPPQYAAILGWRASDPRLLGALHEIRARIARSRGVATTLGIGPRFLHSTGQLHKGGPATGVFLEVVGPPSPDLAVPGRETSLGVVELAQAEGDFDVLAARGRRALLARLDDAEAAPAALLDAVTHAISA